MLRFAGLDERDVRRVRLEERPLGEVDLADWSGIVLGGGPFNVSDPAEKKSETQHRVEAELAALAARVVAEDFPFLGACYGIGTLGTFGGGLVDRTYGEPIGAVSIRAHRGGLRGPAARRPAAEVRGVPRAQGGGVPAAARRRAARVLGRLPGAGVPARPQRLRHPVPPRARRRGPAASGSRSTATTATSTPRSSPRCCCGPGPASSPSRRSCSRGSSSSTPAEHGRWRCDPHRVRSRNPERRKDAPPT